jgi:hypothetical protein
VRRAFLVLAFLAGVPCQAQAAEGRAAFDKLKQLAGDWDGAGPSKEVPRTPVRYELTSNATVVMETLFGGTDHEMRSLYYLDKGELVLTHYCGMGNQPQMRMRKSADPNDLAFDFDGGRNLDPAKDMHMHSARIRIVDANHIDAEWTIFQGGKSVGAHKFSLTRK